MKVVLRDFPNRHALLGVRLICALREDATALDDAAASAHAVALVSAALGLDCVRRWRLDVVPADLDDAAGFAGLLGGADSHRPTVVALEPGLSAVVAARREQVGRGALLPMRLIVCCACLSRGPRRVEQVTRHLAPALRPILLGFSLLERLVSLARLGALRHPPLQGLGARVRALRRRALLRQERVLPRGCGVGSLAGRQLVVVAVLLALPVAGLAGRLVHV